MKIIIIPDVHGRTFWKDAINKIEDMDLVIFLGDYLDPYSSLDYIYMKEAIDNLKEILSFNIKYSDKIITLLGNHDLHYLPGSLIKSSRYSPRYQKEAQEILEEFDLKIAYSIDKYLFTHAGVSNTWLSDCNLTINQLLTEPIDYSYLEMIGYQRGGFYPCGSCIWCDLLEFIESKNTDYYQIFGHTMIRNPIIEPDYACLDFQQCFVLDTEEHNIKLLNE